MLRLPKEKDKRVGVGTVHAEHKGRDGNRTERRGYRKKVKRALVDLRELG